MASNDFEATLNNIGISILGKKGLLEIIKTKKGLILFHLYQGLVSQRMIQVFAIHKASQNYTKVCCFPTYTLETT